MALDYVVIYLRLAFSPSPVDVAVEFDRGLHPPASAEEKSPKESAAAAEVTRAERLLLKQHGADDDDDDDGDEGEGDEQKGDTKGRGGGWWYPGKFLIGLDLLRRLNASASAREREAMGINDASAGGRMASSFDYTGTATRELGPGAIGEGGGVVVRLPTPSSAVFVGAGFEEAEEAGGGVEAAD